MSKVHFSRIALLLTAIFLFNPFASITRAADDPSQITIEPKPRPGVLLNPGKGWSAGGLAKWQPKEVLDLVGMGVVRLEWTVLEPQEGQFNWKPLEDALADWARAGKVCNVGVECASSHSRQPEGSATPLWVFAAGAKKIEIMLDPKFSTEGSAGKKTAPVFDDPVFRAKLHDFVVAFGKRYDGDPRIAILDIRDYGNWGEAHMYPFHVPDIAPEKFRDLVQIYVDAFKRTQLCLSCNSDLGNYGPLKPVFDWAVLEKHIAPRRDGICGNSDGRETAIGFGIAPGVFELYDNYEGLKQRGWWDGVKDKGGRGFRLEDCIENGKPTWVDLSRGGKSGLHMLQENRDLIERLTNRIGYHFLLQRATFPRQTTGNFNVDLAWLNQGVAPIYIPCAVAFGLVDSDGNRISTIWTPDCRPKQWLPGQATKETAHLTFGHVPPGDYHLALAITAKPGDANPYIRLGSDLPTHGDWYFLGDVTAAEH